jgi:glutamyl-tRNA synthetase/glutamyl-Q tRNA(Asp) synthetase
VLTRFAPAPTGWLHLGHVLNAEHVWNAGAAVLLRIEDHDRERCRPEFEAGILDDLDWLGYRPDVFPTDAFRAGRCDGRQSDRDAVYREAVADLASRGLVYACDCTRKQIERLRPERERGWDPASTEERLRPERGGGADRRAAPAPSERERGWGPASTEESRPGAETPDPAELWYPGTCRDRRLPLTDGYGWRVRMDPGAERFTDERLGPQEQNPSQQCGDVLIRDRLGNWTYQFAVSVDDFRQDIDLVIRGVDLLPSTGRQIRLARLLGRAHPARFRHHELIMKSPGQKLSKSDGDTGIRDLRARGWTAAEVKRHATLGRIIGPL